jgi:hypothetical protein
LTFRRYTGLRVYLGLEEFRRLIGIFKHEAQQSVYGLMFKEYMHYLPSSMLSNFLPLHLTLTLSLGMMNGG